jgi:hypothetical protein
MNLLVPGQAIVQRKFKSHGVNGQELDEMGGIKAMEKTVELGPFTLDEVHAEVGTDTRLTISQNYHTVSLGVSIRIPVPANDKAVKKGLGYCRDMANDFLNREMKGARQLLRDMAGK